MFTCVLGTFGTNCGPITYYMYVRTFTYTYRFLLVRGPTATVARNFRINRMFPGGVRLTGMGTTRRGAAAMDAAPTRTLIPGAQHTMAKAEQTPEPAAMPEPTPTATDADESRALTVNVAGSVVSSGHTVTNTSKKIGRTIGFRFNFVDVNHDDLRGSMMADLVIRAARTVRPNIENITDGATVSIDVAALYQRTADPERAARNSVTKLSRDEQIKLAREILEATDAA